MFVFVSGVFTTFFLENSKVAIFSEQQLWTTADQTRVRLVSTKLRESPTISTHTKED